MLNLSFTLLSFVDTSYFILLDKFRSGKAEYNWESIGTKTEVGTMQQTPYLCVPIFHC